MYKIVVGITTDSMKKKDDKRDNDKRDNDCVSNCEGKECGDDGCGFLCQWKCPDTMNYDCENGKCVPKPGICIPKCENKCNVDNGCGGICDDHCESGKGYFCAHDICVKDDNCDKECENKECGISENNCNCGYCTYDSQHNYICGLCKDKKSTCQNGKCIKS